MGAKAGLDASTMLDVINAGSGRNTASADKFPRCVVKPPLRFRLHHRAALQGRQALPRRRRGARRADDRRNAVRQLVGVQKALGGPNSDITTIVHPIEKWAGVEVGAAETGATKRKTA